jgi:N-dimethylarginine dimethylaminohydrolase
MNVNNLFPDLLSATPTGGNALLDAPSISSDGFGPLSEDVAVVGAHTRPTSILMCAPTAYALKYEINPWMKLDNAPDVELAVRQWNELYRVLTEDVGANVLLVPQAPDCPDMVFTANAGLVRGRYALLSNFRHPQRQMEEIHYKAWFETNGYKVQMPSIGCKFEGEGDALFAGDVLLAGYLKRSDICAHRWLSETLAVPVLSLELVDNRWYHLDTCLFPLTPETVVFYPGAFDPYARVVIANNFNTIEVNEHEALRFACNAVVLGNHVVLPSGCPQITGELQSRGYTVHAVEMSEFLKAGGAAKCLTLLLR